MIINISGPRRSARARELALVGAVLVGACTAEQRQAGLEPPSGATLASISLTPASVTLGPGQAATFTVTGTMSDGGTASNLSFVWSGTGGTLGNTGHYSAGSATGSYRVIVTETVSGLADTSTVNIVGTRTLAGIEVNPSGVVLDPASGQSFSAHSLYSDGSSGSATVTWATTGGTISAGGLYQPPATPGTYLVIASQQGGAMKDTALVSVTNDPPPNPVYPHEPAGFVKLTERPFTALNEAGWDVSAASGSVANFSIQSDPNAPFSPSGIGQVLYPAGFEGGGEPVNVGSPAFPGNPSQLYVSFWIRYSATWDGHPSGVNKIFHLWSENDVTRRNMVYLTAEGSGSETLSPEVHLQNVVSFNGFKNLTPNLRASEIVRGRWHRWELLTKVNRSGVADGVAEWWIDGLKVGSYTDIQYVATGESRAWMQLNWAPTWGGNTGVFLPAAQSQQIDHVYISGAP